ncbi:MAG: hypothetical protein AB7O52_03365 [Planctomycetota bacterium]
MLVTWWTQLTPPNLADPPSDPAASTPTTPPANPYFELEDLDESPLAGLPFDVHARADLTVAHFGDSRNVDGYDRNFVNTLSPALSARWEPYEGYRLLTEIEYSGRDGKLEVDQLLVEADFLAGRARLGTGLTYVPFGIERRFYSPVSNPLVDRPSPFQRVFPGSYSDIGVFLSGGLNGESGRGFEAEVALTRSLRGPRREDRADGFLREDEEGQMAGRLGVQVTPHLAVGVSGLITWFERYGVNRRLDLYGVDVLWQTEFEHVRFEFVGGHVEEPRLRGGDFHRSGWYVEFYRRFPIDRPYLKAIETVVRIDSLDEDSRVRDFRDVERWAFGINWVSTRHSRLKFQYEVSDERGHEISNNAFFTQLEVHF